MSGTTLEQESGAESKKPANHESGVNRPTNRLYKNNRNGTLTDVTTKAGLLRTGWGQGVCVGDYDNDGFDNLFVTYWGQNVLYHNNSDGTFTDVTAKAGLVQQGQRPRLNTACCFLDYDKDGTSTSLWPITSTWTFPQPRPWAPANTASEKGFQ